MEQGADERRWKHVWLGLMKVVLWVIGIAYFPVMMSFVNKEKGEVRCSNIRTNVHTKSTDVLISDNGLRQIVKDEFPELVGQRIGEVDYNEIEERLSQSNIVKRCEVYPSADGTVHVEIYQRQPIMRVFTNEGSSYYMDSEGYKIVAKPGMRCHTLIVNGHVNKMMDELDGLMSICRLIDGDPFWKSMIEQISVTKSQEYVMVPRIGNHLIDFGNAERIEQKFNDLLTLYKKGWAKDEWNAYKTVSLKYQGQIICTKR